MDFSLEAYPFTEYLQNLLASIKLVAFAEMNPVMVCGGSFTSLRHGLGDTRKVCMAISGPYRSYPLD